MKITAEEGCVVVDRHEAASAAEDGSARRARVYLWMAGGADAALAAGRIEVESLGVARAQGEPIVDLGAGFGKHALALAGSGAPVLAVDAAAELVAALRTLAGDSPGESVADELRAFASHLDEPADSVLCMGDTVTHLPTYDDVDRLGGDASSMLAPGGTLAFSFREPSPPQRSDRLGADRGDDERLFASALGFDAALARVHDLLQERTAAGWQTRVSVYPKLRLDPARLVAALAALGFVVRSDAAPGGMVQVVATRAGPATTASSPAAAAAGG